MADSDAQKGRTLEIHAGMADQTSRRLQFLLGENNEAAIPEQRGISPLACGIVAAGEVVGKATDDPNHPHDAMFSKLKWLTAVPKRSDTLKYMPVSQIKKVTGRNFWWAKTLKYPYLDREESNNLLEELKKVLA